MTSTEEATRGPAGRSGSFRRFAGLVALLSLPVAIGNLLTIGIAAHFNLNVVSHPSLLLHAGTASARWWHASMLLDVLGYYLMIVPLTLVLRSHFKRRSQGWTDLFVLCLLAYSFIGAIGGVILATVIPPMIQSYVTAPSAHRQILDIVGTGYSDAVYRGMWNLLEEFLAGIGWLGIGLMQRREDRRLGTLTIVLGVACLVDSLGTALNVDGIATPGLTTYLVLAPVWAAWQGIRLLTSPNATAWDGHRRRGPAMIRSSSRDSG